MDASFFEIIKEFLTGSFKVVLMIFMILTPIMIVLEIFKDINLLQKIARYINPMMRFFTLSEEATFPLLAGIFFGISYGSGVILQEVREGKLQGREMLLLSIFFGACHGMIEDTAIFVAIGANLWILVFLRIFAGVLLLFTIGRLWTYLDKKKIMKNNKAF